MALGQRGFHWLSAQRAVYTARHKVLNKEKKYEKPKDASI